MKKRVWTQTEIFNFLRNNPLGVKVHVGDLTDMNNEDYIFYDMVSESIVGYDNSGSYLASVQFAIATRDFDNRKRLVEYLKTAFTCSISYTMGEESEYFIAYCSTTLMISNEDWENG